MNNDQLSEKTQNTIKSVVLLAIVLFIVYCWATCNTGSETVKKEEKKPFSKIDAYSTAQYYVSESLKSPGTADFPDIELVTIEIVQDTAFLVGGYVDAQNPFGAIVRMDYTCLVVHYPTTGKSTCTIIALDQRK